MLKKTVTFPINYLVTYRKISCFFTRNFSDKTLIPFIGVCRTDSIMHDQALSLPERRKK